MICYWKYDNGYHEVDEWQPRCWIRVSNPTADEMTQLEERWQVPLDFVHDAEDADERPRLDTEDGWLLTLVRIPGRETDEDGEVVFTTRPLAILIRDDVCITVGFFPSEVLSDFIAWSNRKHQPERQRHDLLLSILLSSSVWYLKYLKQMSTMMNAAEERLEKHVDNDELQKLMGLGKYLIYFINSLRGNELLLLRLRKHLRLIEHDEDLFDDVEIETQQAYDTAMIYSNILERQQSGYSSIIGNNMNVIMRTLTVITIILMVPTGIAGYYGMNVPNGMESWAWGFPLAIVLSIVLSIVIYYYLKKRKLI